ncbi:MAG: FG-GAP repeat protein [Cellvibrionales bacterium]|nr:FG-GAP repeat protein [Cellvibrionales bacterium]
MVIGAYRWDVPKLLPQKKLKDAGKAYVYSGLDGSVLYTFKGTGAGDWFGYSVAGADINNDGYSDIIVGAHRDDVPDVVTSKLLKDAGSVYVYSGQDGNWAGLPRHGSGRQPWLCRCECRGCRQRWQ